MKPNNKNESANTADKTNPSNSSSANPTGSFNDNTSDKQSNQDKMGSTSDKTSSSSNARGTSEKQQQPLLEKFFVDMLKDIYWAEKHLVENLPTLKGAATTEELRDAFEDHLYQTQKHVTRLEKVFSIIGCQPEAKKCEAMAGLVKEANSIIDETKPGTMTRDAALIIAAQKVEHYEIASYGGLVQLAITMGLNKAADILDDTLMEEEQTDRALTDIAESHINVAADKEENYSWKKTNPRSEMQGSSAGSHTNREEEQEKEKLETAGGM